MQLLKRLFHRCLAATPYEVRRRRDEKTLPTPTLENISLALAYYSGLRRTPTLVQIGACDGVSGDSSHPFIKRGSIKAILVEPVEASFRKLKTAYDGVAGVTLVQAAVGPQDGNVSFFKVREGATSIDPFWAVQLASFHREHLVKHGVADPDIEELKVPCVTFASLLARFQLDSLDILQVDTEGYDAEIVKMALKLPVPPECISFENAHLDSASRVEVFELLERHGYSWVHDRWNTLALHKRLTGCWHQTN